jgi:GNAT superfamily N-acetyltransferase
MAQSTLEIVEVSAADPAAVDAAFTIVGASIHADLPDLPPECRYQFDMQFRVPPPRGPRTLLLARDGDEPLGTAQIDLTAHDNLDKAVVDIHVHPAHRRRGVGHALFAQAGAVARADGRTTVLGFSPTGAAPSAFAASLGLTNGLLDARRRLRLADVDQADLDRLEADALTRAAGYRLVQWGDTLPDEHVEDLAALDSSFMAETPMGDLVYEPEKVDAARLRDQHAAFVAWGSRRYETGLVHEATGRAADHPGPPGAPGPPPRPGGQARQPAHDARGGARRDGDRHLQRGGQLLHDRHQRGHGLPLRRPLGQLARSPFLSAVIARSAVAGWRTWRTHTPCSPATPTRWSGR